VQLVSNSIYRQTDGRTPQIISWRLSIRLSRVAATSTQCDGGERGRRCCRAYLSVRFKLHLRDGRTGRQFVRQSLRWSLTLTVSLKKRKLEISTLQFES